MKRIVLFTAVCVASCGCAYVSNSGASPEEPIGVFPIRLGTNMIVAFVNQTESPLYLELNHKWAEYGEKKHLEDGSTLIVPTFSEDMQSSLSANGWAPARLLPCDLALAIAPMTTNGCQLCGLNLLWQVYTPIAGKQAKTFRAAWNDVSAENWNWLFGFGMFSGDVFAPIPLESRNIKYEAVWKNGSIVKDYIKP